MRNEEEFDEDEDQDTPQPAEASLAQPLLDLAKNVQMILRAHDPKVETSVDYGSSTIHATFPEAAGFAPCVQSARCTEPSAQGEAKRVADAILTTLRAHRSKEHKSPHANR